VNGHKSTGGKVGNKMTNSRKLNKESNFTHVLRNYDK